MQQAQPEPFAARTTFGVGGAPLRWVTITDPATAVETILDVWSEPEPWLIVGGGSNLLVADDGFDGTAVLMATQGIEVLPSASIAPGDPEDEHAVAQEQVRLRVQAGHNWDDLVAYTVAKGLSGIEALSGIPGTVGAAPMQNIGAYGQEVASALESVTFLDFETGEVQTLGVGELGLGYRDSIFKRGRLGVILDVTFVLQRSPQAQPIGYAQLAQSLGVHVGDRVPADEVRAAVLELRASKGMVFDPADPDSRSAGSFFVNPIVSEAFARTLPADAPRWATGPQPSERVIPLSPEGWPMADPNQVPQRPQPRVKLSAAWLIEHAGIKRGYALPGSKAAVSSKHTLALTNRGGATAAEIVQLASLIQARVSSEFGVMLQPEPRFIGLEL
jgi:UDP-N-acetylmuramate dehydrogenase